MIGVVVSGKMRAGKNFASEYIKAMLEESYPELKFTELAFADPIVHIEKYTQEELFLPVEKDRSFRTSLGKWARSKDSNVFVNVLKTRLKEFPAVIVTDARFENEIDMLKEQGFYSIRIIADEAVRLKRGADKEHLYDASEIGLDAYEQNEKFDAIVWNNGTTDEFYSYLDLVITKIEALLLSSLPKKQTRKA